jgi:transketolase
MKARIESVPVERTELANALRFLATDAVEAAKSGHPGMPMGMADIAEMLWRRYLHNPGDPHWPDRDRFVLSNGHGSMLLMTRYNLALGAVLSKVAGKLFRIGHLGDLNELMLLGAIAGAEMAMLDVGAKLEPGSGVAAAQNYWRKNYP